MIEPMTAEMKACCHVCTSNQHGTSLAGDRVNSRRTKPTAIKDDATFHPVTENAAVNQYKGRLYLHTRQNHSQPSDQTEV